MLYLKCVLSTGTYLRCSPIFYQLGLTCWLSTHEAARCNSESKPAWRTEEFTELGNLSLLPLISRWFSWRMHSILFHLSGVSWLIDNLIKSRCANSHICKHTCITKRITKQRSTCYAQRCFRRGVNGISLGNLKWEIQMEWHLLPGITLICNS